MVKLLNSFAVSFVGAGHRAERGARLQAGALCDGPNALPAGTVRDCALAAAAQAGVERAERRQAHACPGQAGQVLCHTQGELTASYGSFKLKFGLLCICRNSLRWIR